MPRCRPSTTHTMRLVILSQYYPPEMGAPQARLSELAGRFVARGHEVRVLTAMPNYPRGKVYPGYGGLWRRERLGAARVLRTWLVPSKSKSIGRRLFSYMTFVASSALAGTFALPRTDVLLTESPPLFLGMTGWWLSRLKRARWVFNVSDLWPEGAVDLGLVREGPALRAARALEAFCYRRAFLVTGQSRSILANIEQRFPEVPTHHLSNGVDPRLFRPDLVADRARFGLPEDAVVALYAGLHGVFQGLDQLLEAAHRLRDMERLRIVLVGDGPEKEALQARARALALGNVLFLEPLPRDAMPVLTASADIAIACLKTKILGAVPSKIYEAMGCGKPLMLVAEGEAAEIVGQTESGLSVAPGDLDGLTAGLRRLTEDDGLRRRLGTAGRRAAETRFDRWAIADRFIDRLEQGLAETSTDRPDGEGER